MRRGSDVPRKASPPRAVALSTLTPAQRRCVLALIAAQEAAERRQAAERAA
jgi:hypothetical protein